MYKTLLFLTLLCGALCVPEILNLKKAIIRAVDQI